MQKEIKISYSWNTVDYPELTHEQRELLQEHAERRIYEMRMSSEAPYTSGELHYEDNEISVWGHWSFSYC